MEELLRELRKEIESLELKLEKKDMEISDLKDEIFALYNPDDCSRYIYDCVTEKESEFMEEVQVKFKLL